MRPSSTPPITPDCAGSCARATGRRRSATPGIAPRSSPAPESVRADEVRYHEDSETLLVRDADRLTTVLRGDLFDEGELEVAEA